MITGGACAIVSLIVVFFFLNSRGAFDALKTGEADERKKEKD